LYRIPALLVVGWRGYGGPPNDAPEHWIMGERTTEFFDLLQMPYEILQPGELGTALDLLLGAIERQSIPGALLVRAGVLE
jgi:sulfopyruvate decarboxylase TPP-binding subunit